MAGASQTVHGVCMYAPYYRLQSLPMCRPNEVAQQSNPMNQMMKNRGRKMLLLCHAKICNGKMKGLATNV